MNKITLRSLANQFEARAKAQGWCRKTKTFRRAQIEFYLGAAAVIRALGLETDFSVAGTALLVAFGNDLIDICQEDAT